MSQAGDTTQVVRRKEKGSLENQDKVKQKRQRKPKREWDRDFSNYCYRNTPSYYFSCYMEERYVIPEPKPKEVKEGKESDKKEPLVRQVVEKKVNPRKEEKKRKTEAVQKTKTDKPGSLKIFRYKRKNNTGPVNEPVKPDYTHPDTLWPRVLNERAALDQRTIGKDILGPPPGIILNCCWIKGKNLRIRWGLHYSQFGLEHCPLYTDIARMDGVVIWTNSRPMLNWMIAKKGQGRIIEVERIDSWVGHTIRRIKPKESYQQQRSDIAREHDEKLLFTRYRESYAIGHGANAREVRLLYETTFQKMPLESIVVQIIDRYNGKQWPTWESDFGQGKKGKKPKAVLELEYCEPMRQLNRFIGPLPKPVKQSVMVCMWVWQGLDQPQNQRDKNRPKPDWYNNLRRDLEEGERILRQSQPEHYRYHQETGVKYHWGCKSWKDKTVID